MKDLRIAGPSPSVSVDPAPRGEFAYVVIRNGIVAGQYGNGVPLREAQLVRELGMSRTPVREALRRLQAEGLVRPIHHGGYVVVEWDREELQQVYAVRIALERLSVRYAAEKRTRVDLAHMTDILDEIRLATAGDEAALPSLNLRFHLTIAESSRNGYLRSMLGNIADIFDRYPTAELTLAARKDAAVAEHEELLAAIEGQDPDRAERAMHEHLLRGMDSLLSDRSGR